MGIEEKIGILLKTWEVFKIENRGNVGNGLTFNYATDYERERITDALVFWKFVREYLSPEELRKTGLAENMSEFWEIRKRFLTHFLGMNFPHSYLIQMIARMEMLPTSVWRKVLWSFNIDFVSFESFLRRQSKRSKLALALVANCNDLHNSRVPRVFKPRERKKITIEALLDEPFDEKRRYASKSEWSYNLLGLDFGFNAYPKGEADDTRVVETSPFVFLSEKNHADDFVVRQEEGGKYWWLYKKARSNYVWYPNRDVQLKTHICPGFWYTLFVHFFFWLVSPVACAFFIAMLSSGNFHKALLAIIPVAAITPLWLLAAGAKALVNSVLFEQNWDKFSDVCSWGFLGGVIIGGASLFVWLALVFYNFLVINHIDILMTLVLLSVPAAFVAYVIHYKSKYDNGERVSGMLEFCFKMYVTAACVFAFARAIQLYHGFFWKIMTVMAYVIAAVSMKIWAFLADFWNITGPLFLGIVVVPLAAFLALMEVEDLLPKEKRDTWFRWLEKISQMLGVAAVSFVCFLIVFTFWSARGIDRTDLMVMVTVLAMGVVMFIVSWMAYANNPVRVEYINLDFRSDRLPVRYLMKNKWLCSLPPDKREEKIKFLQEFFGRLFYTDNYFRYSFLLPDINEGSYAILEYILLFDPLMLRLCKFAFPEELLKKIIFKGMNFEEAEREFLCELAAELEAAEKRREAFGEFFSPLIFIGGKIYFVFSKIAEYGKTLYRLYELFNKRCPYVAKSKPLTGD